MSIQSQQDNMHRLCDLLGRDLGYLHGEREGGPNGAKKTFLHVGRVFLRALAKDLGLRDAVVKSNAAGIAVSGECSLYGMWEEGGIYICLGQFAAGGENVPALPHHPQPGRTAAAGTTTGSAWANLGPCPMSGCWNSWARCGRTTP